MKKQLLLLLLSLLTTLGASAYDFVVNGIYYNKLSSTTVEVTCKNQYHDEYSGSVVIPENVSYGGKNYSVTSIGKEAFYHCSGLTEVTIPNSVKSIGEAAFRGCSGLTSVTIGNSVTSIGNYAFYNCSGLTSVTISNSVTSIGYNAFYKCSGLTSVTIPNSVTSIGDSAFDECSGLTSVTIGNSVTSIGNYAFYNCSGLTSVTIPESVTSIRTSAFESCSGLRAFYGKYASEDNRSLIVDGTLVAFAPSGLTKYTIPNSATAIGGSTFSFCRGLTEVTIPNSVTAIGASAFYGCSSLTSITIPNSVTSIGSYAFSDCSSLTSVTIPNLVTSIGKGAFSGCSGLTSVTIPNSVTTIGGFAFSGCSGLTSVTIPNSVTSIGEQAFSCSRLTSITCLVEDPSQITMWLSVFYNVPTSTCTLNVPKGSRSLYQAAYQWKDFAKIKELSFTPDDGEIEEFQGCYYLLKDGTYTVGGPSTTDYRRIVIPSSINDIPVTAIGGSAFFGSKILMSVCLPSSIQSIGVNAFTRCTNLTKVTILGNTVPTGINDAFDAVTGRQTYVSTTAYNAYASKLGTINVYSNLNSMFESGGVCYIPQPASRSAVAYDCDYQSTNYVVPSVVNYRNVNLNVTSVACNTFRNHNTLADITIGGEVASIGANAFDGCSALEQLTLSDGESDLTMNASLSGFAVQTLNIHRNVVFTGTSPFANMRGLDRLYVLGHATTVRGSDFAGATNLNTLGVGGTVTEIGENAFKGLTKLSDISLDGNSLVVGKNAFANCTALSNVTIETGVATIGDGVFLNCKALNRLTIKSGLTTIGVSAFENCTGIETLSLPSTVATIGNRAFYGCTGVKSAIRITNTRPTTIGDYAFYGCNIVPSFTIGNGTTSIGSYAFAECTGASTISLGNGITSIGEYAFLNCNKATDFNLNSGITSIGKGAFKGCTAISSLTIPGNIKQLPDELVSGCTNLSNLSVSSQLTAIGTQSLKDTPSLASFPIPSTVSTIGAYAFDGCGVQEVSLPSGVTYIDEGAFANTAGLQTVNLNKVTEIRENAFAHSALPALTIPANVLYIKNGAFDGCTSLTDLTIAANTRKLTLGYNLSKTGQFANCGLVNLTLNRDLTYDIGVDNGYSPFYGNTSLQTITAGGNCTAIDQNMFRNCTGLRSVSLATSITAMGTYAFAGSGISTINFPSKLTYIPTHAFDGCPNLATLDVPSSISRIDSYAFAGSGIVTISIPASVTTVPEYMLANTSQLQTVNLADGVTTIAPNAFNGSGLPAINLPASIVSVGNGAFKGCTALADVNIADGSEQLSLGYNASGQGLFYDCHLNSVYIGRNLKYSTSDLYGTSPFYANRYLTQVTVGDLPTLIATKAFYNCTSLTDVRLGDSVESIGDFAFSGCTKLDKFSIGAAITEIGMNAFSDCSIMSEFHTYATVPPYCGDQALDDIDKFQCYLYVPNASISDYAAAPQWCEFFFVEGFDAGANVSFIELNYSNTTLNVGNTLQLVATAYPETALVRTVDWSSSNPSVADVSALGVVTAYAEGEAVITATAKDGSGVTASCTVNVFDPNKPMPYSFSVADTDISKSMAINVPVCMANEEGIISLQFDIQLPAGVTIEKDDDDEYMITPTSRLDNTFIVATSDVSTGIRVLIYSSKNRSITGNEGAIVNLPIVITDQSAREGDTYTLQIKGIRVTTPAMVEKTVADVQATLTVGRNYTPGDVNNDGRFTAVDVSMVVSYVLGGTPAGGIREAADANGDGLVTAVDVAMVVSYVLSAGSSQAPRHSMGGTVGLFAEQSDFVDYRPADDNDVTIERSDLSINAAGNLELGITGMAAYTAAQFDIELPEGVTVKDIRLLGSEGTGHSVAFTQADGMARVLAFSSLNHNFGGNATFEIELQGGQASCLHDQQGNVSSQAGSLPSLSVDGIRLVEIAGSNITEAAATGCAGNFDLSGLLSGLNRGMDIKATVDGVVITASEECDITIADTLGRVWSHHILPGANRLTLTQGVYFIANRKVMVK